jgi:DNA repair and recombination protein RAD54B
LPTELQRTLFSHLLGENRVGQITKPAANPSGWLNVLQTLYKISNSPGLVWHKLQKGKAGDGMEDLATCFPATLDPGDVQLSGKLFLLSKMLKHLKSDTQDKIVVGKLIPLQLLQPD